MKIKKLPYDFTVCQVAGAEDINLNNETIPSSLQDGKIFFVISGWKIGLSKSKTFSVHPPF